MEQNTSWSNCSGTLEDMTDLNQEGKRIQPCASHAAWSACCFSLRLGWRHQWPYKKEALWLKHYGKELQEMVSKCHGIYLTSRQEMDRFFRDTLQRQGACCLGTARGCQGDLIQFAIICVINFTSKNKKWKI